MDAYCSISLKENNSKNILFNLWTFFNEIIFFKRAKLHCFGALNGKEPNFYSDDDIISLNFEFCKLKNLSII